MALELGFLGPTEMQQIFTGFCSTLAIADVFQRPGNGDLVDFVTTKRGKIPLVTNKYVETIT